METSNISNFENTIIIGRVGAYCGSLYLSKSPCWVSDNAIAVQSSISRFQGYCYQLLNSLAIGKQSIGTSQPLLTQGILNNLECLIPLNELVAKYDILHETFYSSIESHNKESHTLAAKDNSNKVRNVLALYGEMKSTTQEITHSQYGMQIIDALFSQPIFRSTEFIQKTGIKSNTVKNFLLLLKNGGILREIEPARGRIPACLIFPRLLNITEGREIF